jgi:hypothetical protein
LPLPPSFSAKKAANPANSAGMRLAPCLGDFREDSPMNSISAIHSHAIFSRQPTTAPAPQSTEDKKHTGNPAQAARTALVDRTDLAAKPFGSIVSLFAKGLPLPPMETVPDAAPDPVLPDPAAPDSETPESTIA